MSRIAIVDYGMGNFHSVARALQASASEHQIVIARSAAQIQAADRVVFPGQGAMPGCMATLTKSGLLPAVLQAARSKPLLGVCVGMQMLFEHSAEGDTPGLGIFAGTVRHLGAHTSAGGLKIPHMGWSPVHQSGGHPLWDGIAQDSAFYFVHSYYAAPAQPAICSATALHGVQFCCAVASENIFAVQFHPEKSAGAGLRMYHNFTRWRP